MTVTDATPAVVVPPGPVPTQRGRVVVGLHRSHDAAAALAVGFGEAHRRATALSVVVIRDDASGPAAAHELLAAVTVAGRSFPTVPVTTDLRFGYFSDILIELSHRADLVVLGLGERPAGMGTDVLIAGHADCPVIVIRESATGGGI